MARTKPRENTISALAYLRTSSAQNVSGDSDARQREAVQRFATAHGPRPTAHGPRLRARRRVL